MVFIWINACLDPVIEENLIVMIGWFNIYLINCHSTVALHLPRAFDWSGSLVALDNFCWCSSLLGNV